MSQHVAIRHFNKPSLGEDKPNVIAQESPIRRA
jgi:hypothetical protein